jgi:hypothetical protein
MAKIPDLTTSGGLPRPIPLAERIFRTGEAVFYGPEVGQGGEIRSPEGELMPPADFDPKKAGIRDPFLADWDLAKVQKVVNPTYEQRKIGLSEWIAGGIGEMRPTLPGQMIAAQTRMTKRAVGSLVRGAKAAGRKFR